MKVDNLLLIQPHAVNVAASGGGYRYLFIGLPAAEVKVKYREEILVKYSTQIFLIYYSQPVFLLNAGKHAVLVS